MKTSKRRSSSPVASPNKREKGDHSYGATEVEVPVAPLVTVPPGVPVPSGDPIPSGVPLCTNKYGFDLFCKDFWGIFRELFRRIFEMGLFSDTFFNL